MARFAAPQIRVAAFRPRPCRRHRAV